MTRVAIFADGQVGQRAIEIAARTSAAPGPGGRPTRKPIEARAATTGLRPDPTDAAV